MHFDLQMYVNSQDEIQEVNGYSKYHYAVSNNSNVFLQTKLQMKEIRRIGINSRRMIFLLVLHPDLKCQEASV